MRILDWQLFRAMPVYMQFIVGLMIVYATGMTLLSGLVVLDGSLDAVGTLAVAAFVWAFALVAVPTLLGSRYESPDG